MHGRGVGPISQGHIPCAICTQFSSICGQIHVKLNIKFGNHWRGSGIMEVQSWGCISPKFLVPLNSKTICQTWKLLGGTTTIRISSTGTLSQLATNSFQGGNHTSILCYFCAIYAKFCAMRLRANSDICHLYILAFLRVSVFQGTFMGLKHYEFCATFFAILFHIRQVWWGWEFTPARGRISLVLVFLV